HVRLVRLLVFREADVAIDAIHGLRADEQFRRDRPHVHGQTLEHGEHRFADVRLVLVFARVEPLAPVVPLQALEKGDGVPAEARPRLHAFACCAACICFMRSCCSRVRCGTMPSMRSMSISWPRWCISCSFAASRRSKRARDGGVAPARNVISSARNFSSFSPSSIFANASPFCFNAPTICSFV